MAPRKAFKRKSNRHSKQSNEARTLSNVEIECKIDFEQFPSDYFLKIVSFQDHYDAQMQYRSRYLATIFELLERKIEILQSAKVRILAAAWARHDLEMSKTMLSMKKIFNFVEVSRAVSILDNRRQINALNRKVENLKTKVEEKKLIVKKSTFKKYDSKIKMLMKTKVDFGSVSGALSRHIREWVRQFTKEELEFMVWNFESTKPWCELADIIHFHPERDFPNLPWFLQYCYKGKSVVPEDSVAAKKDREETTAENVNARINEDGLAFRSARMFTDNLTDESKVTLVKNESDLGRVLWWYEDVSCPAVDEVIMSRLKDEGESLEMSYGKIMERLMLLKSTGGCCFYDNLLSVAEKKLLSYTHNLEGPIAVFADASASMDVAIKTATIISSFLTVFTRSRLIFFNRDAWEITQQPSNIADVIELAMTTKAKNCTCPASALWPFYDKKEKLRTIFVVTDEEENTNFKGDRFAGLFDKYVKEVGPCNLIFVSFLSHQHAKGEMVEALKKKSIEGVSQYVLNGSRPDVSKLDNIIGRLSLHMGKGSAFSESLKVVETRIEKGEELKNIFHEFIVALSGEEVKNTMDI